MAAVDTILILVIHLNIDIIISRRRTSVLRCAVIVLSQMSKVIELVRVREIRFCMSQLLLTRVAVCQLRALDWTSR